MNQEKKKQIATTALIVGGFINFLVDYCDDFVYMCSASCIFADIDRGTKENKSVCTGECNSQIGRCILVCYIYAEYLNVKENSEIKRSIPKNIFHHMENVCI